MRERDVIRAGGAIGLLGKTRVAARSRCGGAPRRTSGTRACRSTVRPSRRARCSTIRTSSSKRVVRRTTCASWAGAIGPRSGDKRCRALGVQVHVHGVSGVGCVDRCSRRMRTSSTASSARARGAVHVMIGTHQCGDRTVLGKARLRRSVRRVSTNAVGSSAPNGTTVARMLASAGKRRVADDEPHARRQRDRRGAPLSAVDARRAAAETTCPRRRVSRSSPHVKHARLGRPDRGRASAHPRGAARS